MHYHHYSHREEEAGHIVILSLGNKLLGMGLGKMIGCEGVGCT